MRRRVFLFFVVLSTVVLVATVGLAIRARFVTDRCWISVRKTNYALDALPNRLVFSAFTWPKGLRNEQGNGYFRSPATPSRDSWYAWIARVDESIFLVGVPYWCILLLCVPFPAAWVLRRRKIAKRRIAGQCLTCGYDLRATSDRCPECGTPAPPIPSPGTPGEG
ncbi:hypothetical protein BH09PLA1_BH09PLA1_12800 [soil metagenome]